MFVYIWGLQKVPIKMVPNETVLHGALTTHLDKYYELGNASLPSYMNTHWLQYGAMSYTAHVVLGLIITPVMFLAVTGNGVVIYVFTRFKSLRTPANVLVVNLALSDLLMAATGYPLFIIASLKGHWIFGKVGCDFYGSTGAFFGLMSINCLAAIAVERFCVIYKGQRITKGQLICFVVAVWLVSLMWAVPPLIGWSRYVLEGYQTTCSYDYLTTDSWDRYFLLAVTAGDFILPMFIICYCYIKIMLKFKAHQREYQSILKKDINDRESSYSSTSSVTASRISRRSRKSTDTVRSHLKAKFIQSKKVWSKTEYRIARTVFMVILVYCVSWTPYAVISMVAQYGNADFITPTAAMIPIIIAKLSTVYNPFIYAISHPKFKSAIRKTFPSLLCLCRSPFNKKRNRRDGFKHKDEPSSPKILLKLGNLETDSCMDSDSELDNSVSNATKQPQYNLTLEGQTIPAEFLMQLLKETAQNNPKGKVTLTFKGGTGPGKVVMNKKQVRLNSDVEESKEQSDAL